jgi:hypothetical protein
MSSRQSDGRRRSFRIVFLGRPRLKPCSTRRTLTVERSLLLAYSVGSTDAREPVSYPVSYSYEGFDFHSISMPAVRFGESARSGMPWGADPPLIR